MRKHKQHILCIVVILLSLVSVININNTSALSYQSNVGIGFTFNPTLSISLSSSGLVIPNLAPGTTEDSNSINVSVATNAAYGYTLSAIMNGNNSNLTHNNGTNVFSSIATDADLSDLEDSKDTNIWGYSYKDNTAASPAWSNYNGLSSSDSTALINTNSNTSSNLDFKIAAKASETQPSGEYTGTINFIAVTKVAPMSLLDSFIASGAEQLNGYFKMQDMTHSICSNVDIEESELQLIDVRDNKVYWVAKLKDGNCWMTQNLELDLDSTATAGSTNALTSENTNLKTYGSNGYDSSNGYSCSNAQTTSNCTASGEIITWVPVRNTVTSIDSSSFPKTAAANSTSYSYDPGDVYYYTSNSTSNDTKYTLLSNCTAAGHTEGECRHYKAGNYYNWSASVASNNTSSYAGVNTDAGNSVCPRGWRLPKESANEFQSLIDVYGITATNALDLRNPPLYFVRSGYINGGSLVNVASFGFYWSSTVFNSLYTYGLYFSSGSLGSAKYYSSRYFGFLVRCLAE